MARVAVVHFKPEEAEPLLAKLRAAKLEAALMPFPPRFRKDDPPAAVVISLARSPTHGRWVGYMIRRQKWSRHIPIVFVDGEAEKVARVKQDLPDAAYTTTAKVASVVQRVLKSPPPALVVPRSFIETDRPLLKKLLIEPGQRIAVMNEPPRFRDLLGDIPEDVEFIEWPDRNTASTFWFARTLDELDAGMDAILRRIGSKPLWVCWPKRSSGTKSDLTMVTIRALANRYGRVGIKVVSIDGTWSADLILQRRKSR